MAYNLREQLNKKERFEAGHRLCAGCGAGSARGTAESEGWRSWC